eukprot:TRINITY_DN1615_c1_g1_i1.p1 TRINITY_DN1615_c1_g1~~TRINITY_DN1615_c1_g1_i1.p1  ORF type:complete len:168 (+),score=33.72 TRINITY_DN1615_c1_g1_i1:137-640(+)
MSGATLKCTHCPKKCGTMIPARIVTDSSCADYSNEDGVLVCVPLPSLKNLEGNFRESCSGCFTTKNKLVCLQCKGSQNSKEGIRSEVLIDGCKKIDSKDGSLICVGNPGALLNQINQKKPTLPKKIKGAVTASNMIGLLCFTTIPVAVIIIRRLLLKREKKPEELTA